MSDKEPSVEEALAQADAYTEVNAYGGDTGYLRTLAERVRELERKVRRAAKPESAKKPASKK